MCKDKWAVRCTQEARGKTKHMKQRHSPAYRPPLCEPVPARCPHVSGSPRYSHQSQTSREPQRTKAIPCRSRTSSQSCVRNHDTYSCANRYEQRALCAPTHVSTGHKPIPCFSARSQGQFSGHRALPTAPPLFKMLSCRVKDFLFLGRWRHPSQALTRTKNTRSFVNRSTLGNRLNARVRKAGKGKIKMKWMVKGFSVSWVQRIRETWELMKQPCSATGTFGYLNTEPDCLLGFKSCLCHFLAVWNWMGCLRCPSHSFLTCNMGTITSTL